MRILLVFSGLACCFGAGSEVVVSPLLSRATPPGPTPAREALMEGEGDDSLMTLMMLNKAGVISDADMMQQFRSAILQKSLGVGPKKAETGELEAGGGQSRSMLLPLLMMMGGGQQGGGRAGKQARGGAVSSGSDPLKSLMISSALSGGGGGNNMLLPLLLSGSFGTGGTKSGAGTCHNNCGNPMPRQDCGCDEVCRQNDDCCDDFEDECRVQVSAQFPQFQGSLQGQVFQPIQQPQVFQQPQQVAPAQQVVYLTPQQIQQIQQRNLEIQAQAQAAQGKLREALTEKQNKDRPVGQPGS